MFLWIGIDMWRHPETWLGYVPAEPGFGMSRAAALSAVSAFDAGLGVLFWLHMWPRTVSFLAAAHLLGVLAVNGIDAVLIRDVGLLGAALAMALWPAHYRRRGTWLRRLPWPFNRSGGYEE